MLLTQYENSQGYLHVNTSFSSSSNTYFQLLRQLQMIYLQALFPRKMYLREYY